MYHNFKSIIFVIQKAFQSMLIIRPRITPYFGASEPSQTKASNSPPPPVIPGDLFTRVAKTRAATRNRRIELKRQEPDGPWITGPQSQSQSTNKAITPSQRHLISTATVKALARLPQSIQKNKTPASNSNISQILEELWSS